MTGLLAIGLANALTALVAALVVSIVARFLERPALVHAMWLLVLLELLAPPVFEIDMLPGALRAVPSVATFVVADAGAPTGAETPAGARATVAPERVATPPAGVETDLLGWAIAAWLAGAAVVIGLALVRVVRLHRRLRGPARAPRRLRRRLDRLAREMGLGRPPALRIVRSHLSPCVWLRPGGSELLFPAALLGRLTPRETDALL
ncbi:MAG TPA: M56 family metallopeptidase, partial [Candidatus Polarisedimenticolaceae bacterium]|nr:M56 family metallopeptidase [Candidatus Polarisedimenticolaceae bacterium]